MAQLKALLAAFQFLTRLPLGWIRLEKDSFGRGLVYFPLVGLVIGTITAIIYTKLLFLPGQVAAAMILMLHVLLTGGLHWDGLLDTIDAVFSARDRETMLEIMKDSRVGAHGVTGAVLLFLLKFSLLLSLPEAAKGVSVVAIIAVTVMLARWNMSIALIVFPYARKNGLGTFFREKGGLTQLIIASIGSMIISYWLLSTLGFWLIISSLVLMYLFSRLLINLIGGLTGDTYGALCELEEIWLLITAVILLKL